MALATELRKAVLPPEQYLDNLLLLWCDMFFPSSHNFTLWCVPDEVQYIPSLLGCAKQVHIPWVLQVGVRTHHQALTQSSTNTYL